MFTKSQLFATAAVAASATTVLAAPIYDAVDLEVRGGVASKVIGSAIKIIPGVGTAANSSLKGSSHTANEQKKKGDTAKQNSGGHRKREVEDVLFEHFARGPAASKEIKDTIAKAASSRAGRKIATEVGKNVYTKVAGNALDEQKKKDAARHNQHHQGHGKRDLVDDFEARDFDDMEEFYARGPGASKAKDTIAKAASSRAGRKVATEVGKNVYTKVAGNQLDEQKKKDATKKNHQHDGHSHGKRDLEDVLDELFARGPGASKAKDTIAKAASSRAGRKVASEVGKNVYTKVAGNKLDEQKKKDAAKQGGHHNHGGHSKRDLDIIFDALEAREFDDLEELYMRGPGASKVKENIAKAATSRAGRKVASEIGKNVYTKVGGGQLDEQKKKDAKKSGNHHNGHGRRDLEPELFELIGRERDLYDDLD